MLKCPKYNRLRTKVIWISFRLRFPSWLKKSSYQKRIGEILFDMLLVQIRHQVEHKTRLTTVKVNVIEHDPFPTVQHVPHAESMINLTWKQTVKTLKELQSTRPIANAHTHLKMTTRWIQRHCILLFDNFIQNEPFKTETQHFHVSSELRTKQIISIVWNRQNIEKLKSN